MKRFIFLIAISVVSFLTVQAQITPNVYKSMEYRREMMKIIGRGLVNRQMTKGATKSGNKSALKAVIASGTTAFKFDSKYFAPDLILTDFKGTAAEKTTASRNIAADIDFYKSVALKDGFPANDLAYGFNFFIIHNLIIYNGVKCTALELGIRGREDSCSIFTAHNYTLDDERAIYNQFRKILDTPETAKLTDAEKQTMTEFMALKTTDLFNRWSNASQAPMTIENYNIKMEAAKNLEDLLQIPAAKISISKEGVKP